MLRRAELTEPECAVWDAVEAGTLAEGGAHIGGRLTFATATLSNPRGRALQAERLTVEQDLFFTEGFRATGEMHLAGAHVGGTLSFDGATLGSNHGALTLADLRATTCCYGRERHPDAWTSPMPRWACSQTIRPVGLLRSACAGSPTTPCTSIPPSAPASAYMIGLVAI